MYQSDDLQTWKRVDERHQGYEGGAIKSFTNVDPDFLHDIYFRPQVVYNNKTSKYVMWLNRIPSTRSISVVKAYVRGEFLVATASNPEGPFEIIPNQPVFGSPDGPVWSGAADFALIEAEGTAFNAYGSWSNYGSNSRHAGSNPKNPYMPFWIDGGRHSKITGIFSRDSWPLMPEVSGATSSGHTISVQELNEDFTGFKNSEYADASHMHHEAPLFFTRKDAETGHLFYYIAAGTLCCFCEEGSNLELWMFEKFVNIHLQFSLL